MSFIFNGVREFRFAPFQWDINFTEFNTSRQLTVGSMQFVIFCQLPIASALCGSNFSITSNKIIVNMPSYVEVLRYASMLAIMKFKEPNVN